MAIRSTYTLYSSDFDISGFPPSERHYRMGIGADAFPDKGINVFIDDRYVGVWTNKNDNLWIHFDEGGLIDSFLYRKKNTGIPTWE